MNQDFEYAYKNAKDKRKKSERIRIEKIEKPKEKFGLLKKIFLSKKYNDSLVKKLSAGELTVAQLKRVCEIKSVNRHSMISDGAVSS